jgi:hypothetical protein
VARVGGGRSNASGWDDGRGLMCGSGVSVSEEPAQQAVALLPVWRTSAAHGRSERLVLCVLVGVLLSVVHLLLERLRLLLIGKRKRSLTVLELEGMEEHAILVVAEGVVYLLVPNDAAAGWLPLSASMRDSLP